MTVRPTASLFAQGAVSAGAAIGTAAAILIGIGALAFFLNWLMLLLVLPSGGALSAGASMLVFGVAFPIGWMLAAQPVAFGKGLQRLFRRNRDQLLSWIESALARGIDGKIDPDPERWLHAIDNLRSQVDRLPFPARSLGRLGIRRTGAEAIESALRTRSGPVPSRVAEAIVDRLDAEFAGNGSKVLLWLIVTANLLGYGLIFLVL